MEYNQEILNALIQSTSIYKHIPENAVAKDILICQILYRLNSSPFVDNCIFKGGTSLSKCYPGTIERFSEDIDLTYLPEKNESVKSIERKLKAIEKCLTLDLNMEKIESERSTRNKSAYVWNDSLGKENRIKLEIGSSVRPEPYTLKEMKSYIQEFLETIDNGQSYIQEYGLKPFTVNTLNIERTFMDKLFAIKRHTIEGSINTKARHLYDVKQLYTLKEIQAFLHNKQLCKELIRIIKQTDEEFLTGKRVCQRYVANEPFNYPSWKEQLKNKELQTAYESLHKNLLYTDKKQSFSEAIAVIENIAVLLESIGE